MQHYAELHDMFEHMQKHLQYHAALWTTLHVFRCFVLELSDTFSWKRGSLSKVGVLASAASF